MVWCRIFSIPQDLYGERIKPFSIDLEVTTQGDTYTIKDDGEGNLYDNFSHQVTHTNQVHLIMINLTMVVVHK